MSGKNHYVTPFRKLLRKYIAGSAQPKEEEVLENFFSAMQQNGISSEEVKHNLALRNRIREAIEHKLPKEKKYTNTYRWAASLAAILLVATSLLYLRTTSPGKDMIVRAERGQQREVILPDSSKVFLNAGSTLSYPQHFTATTREVKLEGEAYFEVTHNVDKPFIVSTPALTTQVLGTQFSVTGYANEVAAVTVVSGRVKVTDAKQRFVYLTANERATADLDGKGLTKRHINAGDYVSWMSGRVFFDAANIQQVIAILNKRYDAHLQLRSPADNTCTISGKFSSATLDGILESISFIYDMKYERDPASGTISIYMQPCSTKK